MAELPMSVLMDQVVLNHARPLTVSPIAVPRAARCMRALPTTPPLAEERDGRLRKACSCCRSSRIRHCRALSGLDHRDFQCFTQ